MKKKKELYNDSWLYILLLTTLVILIEALKNYTFILNNVSITYSIFLLPLVYLLTNYITKKYTYQRSIVAISISGVSVVLFTILMNFALGKEITLMNISGQFCAYVVSQFINLTIYNFLLNNTKPTYILIFQNYLFTLIIFYMFYTLINLNILVIDEYWTGYFTVVSIQTFMCLILAFIDKKIKRGIE